MLARARLRWLAREGSRRAGEGDCTYSRVYKHKRSEGTKIECAGLLAEYMILAGPQSRPEGRPCCAVASPPTGRGASSGAWGVRFNLFTTEVPWVAKRSGCAKRDPVCRRVARGVRALGVSREARARPNGCLEGGDPRTRLVPKGPGACARTGWSQRDLGSQQTRGRGVGRGAAHTVWSVAPRQDQPGCAPVCAADSPARRGRARSGRVSTRSGGGVARARATHKR